jgi:hypothetical protein
VRLAVYYRTLEAGEEVGGDVEEEGDDEEHHADGERGSRGAALVSPRPN